MRKWMPALLIAIAFIASALTLPRLPETVTPNLGALLPFETSNSEPASRAFVAFCLPTAALGAWLLTLVLTSRSGFVIEKKLFGRWAPAHVLEPEAIDRFRGTFDLILTIIIAIMLAFHAMLLAQAAGGPAWIIQLFAFTTGLGLALAGNIAPRIRPNPVMGVRTRATLNDPILWARMHRLFGGLLVVSGALVMLLALVALRYAMLAFAGGVLVSCLVVLIALLRSPKTAATGVVVAVLLLLGNGVIAQMPGRPDSIPPTDVREEARSFKSGSLTLDGTLALPARSSAPAPVVVIVVGSGPTDRNGNGPLAQTNLYRQLAWQLAERGIASFRYDKRGIGPAGMTYDSAQIAKLVQQLVIGDFVDDVVEAVRLVDADARFGNLFLLGHSEGAQLVLQASNRGVPAAGVIMVSGMGRPLRAVLHDQFALQFPAAEVMRLDSAFVKYLAGEDVTGIPPGPVQALFFPLHRNLVRSMAVYDPVAEIRRANKPLLLVHGGLDVQTTEADAQPLRAAKPTAAVLDIPNANHVFKAVPSLDLSVQRPTYMNAALPIVPELAAGIADWILKR